MNYFKVYASANCEICTPDPTPQNLTFYSSEKKCEMSQWKGTKSPTGAEFPDVSTTMPETSHTRGESIVRWVIFSHLIAIAVCLAMTLADRGLLVNSSVSDFVENNLMILLLPALLAGLVLPAVLLIAVCRGTVARRSTVIGIIAEILLCVAQLYVLLPAVM